MQIIVFMHASILFCFPMCSLTHTHTHSHSHIHTLTHTHSHTRSPTRLFPPHTETAERKRLEQQLAALQLAHQQRVDSARQEQAREETEQDLAHARAMADAQDAHRAQVQYTALFESNLSLSRLVGAWSFRLDHTTIWFDI